MTTLPVSPRKERHSARAGQGNAYVPEDGRREWLAAIGSALLLWLAFPPVNAWLLAWVAPFGWLRLISSPHWRLRRPYRMLYVTGLLHWLLVLHWIRLPHWSAYLGWLALAAYLAAYVPLFVSMSRALVHGAGMSSVLAAPIVWTGLELVRGRLFSGFAMALLGHTQLELLPLVQIADLGGAYAVSFLVMLVAASIERTMRRDGACRAYWPVAAGALSLLAAFVYGTVQIRALSDVANGADDERRFRAALIQGALDTQFDGDSERERQAFLDYVRLSRGARSRFGQVDVMIWPESMFTGTEPMVTYESPLETFPGWQGSTAELERRLDEYERSVRDRFRWVADQVATPLLVGVAWDHYEPGRARRYNSAVLTDRHGAIVDRYDKMHLVMFGEYVPLGRWFPWLYRLTPMPDGLTAGREPKAFDVNGVILSPTICFENTVPHLMRRQVRELTRRGQSPDVLVTVTNDGWFWGSSLLDLHLACGVFRAIELRRPLLIAANTGFSASIEPTGRVRVRGPRRAAESLLADVALVRRDSLYLALGDSFAALCLAIALVGSVGLGWRRWRPTRRQRSDAIVSQT